MSLGPQSLRGLGAGKEVAGQIDYRLVRNSVVSEFRKGRLSRLDICDAHPDLVRAAQGVGEETREECPICEESNVCLVSYAFGAGLPASGTCVTTKRELTNLSRRGRDLVCYVVEVCPGCGWNHLLRSFAVGPQR